MSAKKRKHTEEITESSELFESETESEEAAEQKLNSVSESVEKSDTDTEQQPEAEITIESLQLELAAKDAEFKDQLLRAKAEVENVRRRTDKQISDSRKYANEAIARELLAVRDSLQLAAQTELEVDDTDAVKSMREGLDLTLKQVDSLFEKFHIAEIAPQQGDKLDPNLHQAMTMVSSDEVEAGAIIETIQSGYQLHDRLLRPAMVVVAQK